MKWKYGEVITIFGTANDNDLKCVVINGKPTFFQRLALAFKILKGDL